RERMMLINLTINDQPHQLEVVPKERLLDVLRREGYFGAKHGCDTGHCGACAVILDGVAVNSCVMLAAQADGHSITTVEGLGRAGELHPLQRAFIQCGAIQCGFCSPGLIMAAQALLRENPHPTETEVRQAIAGNLCRCTGYLKPVQAVLRAAAELRGESWPEDTAPELRPLREVFGPPERPGPERRERPAAGPEGEVQPWAETEVVAPPEVELVVAPERPGLRVVGQPEPRVDGPKLATGRATFTDDFVLPGMLHGKLLLSPHAHARINRIDASKARTLPGVHAVLTHEDIPRVPFTTAGQSHPIPGPQDCFSLPRKVRFVGDRVAAVAAETPEMAEKALELIEVEYEVLPAILDAEQAQERGAPVIHDEEDALDIPDAAHNLAAHVEAEVGDVEQGFAQADLVIENEYRVPRVQQTPLETHVCITYWDEDERLVVRTSTQVPFHVRRIIAPVVGLPLKRIRVIKPRIGGGFGSKQEILIEDICAHLTIATGRPVRLEYSREEEFMASRSRHPMIIHMKTGVKRDGTITANQMSVLSDTGAYGGHALTVPCNTGSKSLPLYRSPNIRFEVKAVYTNLPPAGAFRGYGAPQGFFTVESQMDEVAHALGMDPVEFRRRNWIRTGDDNPLSVALGEGKEGFPQHIVSCGLPQCVEQGTAAIGWEAKRCEPGHGPIRRGVGIACAMHGSAIPGLDMGAASIKMNDDGSFNLLVGATDIGTGSDTILSQIAAEVLGCPIEDILIYSSDTDFTPFDKGAYASSTTFISGGAVKKAAEDVRQQIIAVAARMLEVDGAILHLADSRVWAPDGRSVTLEEVALESLHHAEQHQIMATASHMSYECPPPFAAQFAAVEVDIETGEVRVLELVSAVDAGRIINPPMAEGQVEGSMAQALGYAVCEEMIFDPEGRLLNPRFGDYKIFAAGEMPRLVTILVETEEPSGPFGAKAVAEIPMDGVAPAVANAVFDATGVRIRQLPLTPERVWRALYGRRAEKPDA
ncbi:MAG: molybdopterin-dependent oxidoreductase, partial [Anaerolineae bacterium]